ncbi:unnamed protein product [Umbelopsis ramanniana]
MYKSYNRQPNVKLVNADPAQIYSNMSPTPICMGGQATIHTCRHPQTGRRIAVKRICLPRSLSEKQKTRQMAINEAAALASCKCESVVRLADSNIYEAYDSVFIIMEYISGRTLYESLIRQRRPFEEPEIVKILKDVVDALMEVHDQDMAHCDIKSDNIILGDDGTARLIDFGFVSMANSERDDSPHGQYQYWAPEVAAHLDTMHMPSRDIWALGIMTVEMLQQGQLSSGAMDSWEYMQRLATNPIPSIPSYASPALKNFIEQCLDVNPNLRATATELHRHSIFEEHSSYESPTDSD